MSHERMRSIMIWNKEQRVEMESDSSAVGMEINKNGIDKVDLSNVFDVNGDVKYLIQIWNGEGFDFCLIYKEDANKALLKAIDERFSVKY